MHAGVLAALTSTATPYAIHRHADPVFRIRTPDDLASALERPVSSIAKTLLVEPAGKGSPFRIVAPVTSRVDLVRVAAAMGTSRLELATRASLGQLLGQPPGGVSPLGGMVPVVLDAALLCHDTVLVGAGEVGLEIELSTWDLVRITHANVLHISGQTHKSIMTGAL